MGIEFHVFGYFLGCFFGVDVVCGGDAGCIDAHVNSARCVFGILCLRICGLILQQQIVGPPKGWEGERPRPLRRKNPPVGQIDKLAKCLLALCSESRWWFPNLTNICSNGLVGSTN